MKLVKSKEELNKLVKDYKLEGKTVGFVPTMGALHEGHISLIKTADQTCDISIVSVFVNPTQFNNKEDLDKYPRTIENDAKLIESTTNCRIIFYPEVDEMYDENETLLDLDLQGLDTVMEGQFRPGHFQGVVTVVDKLFKIVEPDCAFFGEKDFQQLAIIKLLQRELHPNLSIIPCEIIREKSGLAMSSRNERLTAEDREYASNISKILFELKEKLSNTPIEELIEWTESEFKKLEKFELEYVSIVDSLNLKDVKDIRNHDEINICVAVFLSGVRLIDNVYLKINK
jgi:pantoate--beta-alanine ligase